MSRLRIGEALLSRGLVTATQLQQALRDQEILGGHLGTCLIELGFVDEDRLGKTLGELLNMRYATWKALAEAPEDAIKTLSVELVEQYNVVPLQLEERTLHIATVAPRTLSALSRATGKRIVPWIAPEIRILQAMELHYGIPLQPRYIKIREQLDSLASLPAADETNENEAEAADDTESSSPEDNWISPPDDDGPDPGEAFGYGRSWRDIAEQQFDEKPAPKLVAVPPAPAPAVAPTPGPVAPAFANSASAGIRRDTMRHVAGLLRVRQALDTELGQLGFPVDEVAAGNELARWVAKASLDLKIDPAAPDQASDQSGYTYRIIRAIRCLEEGCVLETPLVPPVDFFLAVRLDEQFRVHSVIRATYEALAASGIPHGGEIRVAWDVLETQGTGIEVLYSDGTSPATNLSNASCAGSSESGPT